MAWSDILGGIQTVGNLASQAWNAWTGHEANVQNLELQNKEWQREDTSVQRKVADLKAAGLNTVLAASGGGEPTSLGVRVNPVNVSMPDLSQVYSSKLAATAVGTAEANARAAAANAGVAETQGSILQKQYGLRSDLVPGDISPLVWFPVAKMQQDLKTASANALRAESDARTAESQAEIEARNNRLADKYQEGLTIMNLVGGGVGAGLNATRAGAILAPK